MPHLPASRALARFRVVDMTQVRAGPTAARQLADWGADVIQVQMPEHMRGDDTLGGQEGSDYQYTHRNKRSITLNLKEAEGIAVLNSYTLMMSTVALHAINPGMIKQRFHPIDDFTPIALVSSYPMIMIGSPQTAFKSIPELKDLAAKQPTFYSSSGVGSPGHLRS